MGRCNRLCRRDPDSGDLYCPSYGWVDGCPMDGVEEDEDGFIVNTNNANNNKENEDED